MNKSNVKSIALFVSLVGISFGCNDQKAPPAAPSPPTQIAASLTAPFTPSVAEAKPAAKPNSDEPAPRTVLQSTETGSSKAEPSKKPERGADKPGKKPPVVGASKSKGEARPFPEAKLLDDDTVAVVVAHPMQFLESPIGKLLTELETDTILVRGAQFLSPEMQKRLREVERVTVVVTQELVDEHARMAGLDVLEVNRLNPPAVAPKPAEAANTPTEAEVRAVDKRQLTNAMKQIGLAFHNYHDTFNSFPRADGDGPGNNSGLSWHIHLLPFLDQAPLYNQFRFDEDWDSDHNKSLISQMPDVFKSPGVTDDEKTSFHVFTGEKTPFHGDQGLGIRNFTDGTSNTILAVLAGADTAEIWTKPGGLEVDLSAPKKSLGEIKEPTFLALFTDGSVHQVSTEIDDVTLSNLIQPADGNVIDPNAIGMADVPVAGPPMPIPTIIYTFAKAPPRDEVVKELLGQSTDEAHEGQTIHVGPSAAVWLFDDRTVVMGTVESLKKLIGRKPSDKSDVLPLVAKLQLNAELTAAVDVESQQMLLQQIGQGVPGSGMISNIDTVAFWISMTGKEGDSLFEVNVTAVEPEMAAGLSALANLGLSQAKMGVAQVSSFPNTPENEKELQKIGKEMVASAVIEVEGENIRFRLPIPSGFDRVPELLKPSLMKLKDAAQEMQFTNHLRMMGLAFHNWHDVYGNFPGAARIDADRSVGLSWRVLILPFLDQAPLYNQFKLDEPWDSEHNKTLIEKMPEIFKSPGVEEAGKTAYHIFTGPGAPFADDQAPKIQQFTDGTSNTILVVLAGPDTAEIWTKPGGLDFDPDDPIKAFGKLIGNTIKVLFADGSVQTLPKDIDSADLRRRIQMNDGEPLQ